MKRVIYYFSGTGNSLEIANLLAARLDAETVGIASLREGSVDCGGRAAGIVFPVYMYRPPRLVADFLKRLSGAGYLFVVAVNGGDAGNAMRIAERLLQQSGNQVNASFSVRMPDNYIPFGGPPPEKEQSEMFANAQTKVDGIVRVVESADAHREKAPSWFKTRVYPEIWYALGYWAIPFSDKGYWVNDRCNGCGVCERVCPVGNISMTDGKPVWNQKCEQCMACIQWCKETAVELGKKSQGVVRYTNPRVTRKQIVAQKGA